MKILLNEVSVPSIFNNGNLNIFLDDLITAFSLLKEKKIGTKQLKLHLSNNFKNSHFGTEIINLIYSNSEWEKQALFSALIDCIEIEEIIFNSELEFQPFIRVCAVLNNNEIPGLAFKAAVYSGKELTALYSFMSMEEWLKSNIELKAHFSETNYINTSVLNFSVANHSETQLFINKAISQYLEIIDWDPSKTYFPFCDLASMSFKEDCIKEISSCKSSHDRIPIYRKFGESFCLTNGYSYDIAISRINSNSGQIRDIYSAGSGRSQRFISIDVENGGFEFCEHDGTHLGTFGWNGNKIGDPKITTHSILIVR